MAETETAEVVKDYMQPLAPHEEGVTEGAVVSVIDQAEINQQITTARRYPRSVNQFRRRLYEMVTIDTDTAESCIYAIPRDGKMIDGPSIRFAELLLVGWGNNRAAAEVTSIDEEFVVASGMFFDLETNSAIQAKVMRRITGKPSRDFPKGRRFSNDMIVVTGNAACSIAIRNAILRGIPKALWKDVWDEAKKVAAGNAKTFTARRDQVMKELGIQGATPDQIFGLLGIKGIEDMQTEHVVHLRGLQNAIKDGETTLEEAFKPGLKQGEVAPSQPARSDFERGANKTTGEAKAEPKPDPKPEPQQADAQATESTAKAEPSPAKAGPASDRAAALKAQFADWYADQKKELAGLTKVRPVAEMRDAVAEQLEGDQLKEWDDLCAAKQKEILDAMRTKK